MSREVVGWVLPQSDVAIESSVLSPAERRRAEAMGSETARRSFVSGRVALRHVVACELGIAPSAVDLVVSGKPSVPGSEELHLSLSRAESTVAIALSGDGPVGIDVDTMVGRRRSVPSLAYDDAKLEAVSDHVSVELAALAVWVVQEAALKADGIGLLFPLDRVSISNRHDGLLVGLRGRGSWGAVVEVLDDETLVAVATRRGPPVVTWRVGRGGPSRRWLPTTSLRSGSKPTRERAGWDRI